MYYAAKCVYAVVIYWCKSRKPLNIFIHLSMLHQKDILLLSDVQNHMLILSRLLSTSWDMERVWINCVENLLVVNANVH